MRLILLLIFYSLLTFDLSAQACTDAESGVLTVSPPLPAGGANYPVGTVLDMCFTLNEFDTPQANWLHAIIPQHGPGFDLSTLVPVSSPASCNGNGTWGWYDMWTSCALGIDYGPGFSYDGTSGLGCGATANDGDPGNNWGDGGGFCTRTWCWQITTGPAPTGCNAESYLTQIFVYGDGEAGSWSNAPCLNDAPLCWPQITDVQAMVNNPCPGNDFTLSGSFDAEAGCGIQVEWNGPNGFTSSDLNTTAPYEGDYTLSINIAGCTTYDVTVTAMWNATTPGVTPGPSTTFCYGETVTMTGTGGDSYLFTAPDGTTYTTNPVVFTADETTEGVWTVTVYNAPDCEDDVFSEIIVLPELNPMATAAPDPVCEGEDVTLTGSGAGPGGTYVWGGGVPAFTGNPYIFTPPGPGSYTATLTITNSGGCSETVDVTFTVNPDPFVTITANPMASCEGDPVVLTATGGGTYAWSNGMSGSPITVNPTSTTTYTVTVTNSFGCTAEESITIDVQPLLDAPLLDCSSTNPSNITWTWPPVPGADFYHIYIDGVLVETNWTSNSYTVTGLDPITTVNIRVIPFSNNNTNCPGQEATLTCTTPDCNPVSFFLESPMTFCYDPTVFDPIQLIIGVSGMDASQGSVQWSGPGVLFPGSNPGQFIPPSAGTYTLTATFTLDNGSCEYSEDFTFTVVESANAEINASDLQVCSDETVTVSLAGTFNPAATYDWDFGGATVISGTNEGPYELSFPGAGSYDISLMTSLGDCDDMDEITITVDDPLSPPVVFCQYTTQDTVIFAWADVAGASGYTVNVISGPSGTRIGNTYVVSGLSFGDQVEITVTATSSGNCPDVTSLSQICEAQSCPDAQLSIDNAPQTFCNDGNNDPIDLTLTLTDAVAPTDTVWSGPGVVGSTFDADIAGPGVHSVSVTVTDENCPFTTSVIMTVRELPTADFTASSPVCIDSASLVTYTGTADPATSTFNWDFGGGTVVSGSDGGPYEISWPTAGSYVISLAVNDGNCASTEVQQTVEVLAPLPAPVVNCVDPALDGFTFEWAVDTNATGYEVTLISGPAGTQMGNTYVVSGLNEGDQVTIQVVALGDGPCGNSAPTLATCEARSCEMIETVIGQQPTDFCQDGNNDFVVMTATTLGGAGDGVFTWSGPGISNDTFFVADAVLGANEIVLTYVEAGCTYQDTVVFTLYELPDPGFTIASSPACTDQVVEVTYEVAMPLMGSHAWTFTGGNPATATGPGPHSVSWPTAGTYTITHDFTVNGCTNTVSQEVVIEDPLPAPDLSCGQSDLNSTTVNWSAITGNLGYAVSVNGSPEDTVLTTSYTVSGLTPDSTVTISVRVLGSAPCGDGPAATISCSAAPCPNLSADFSLNTMAICLDTAQDQSTVLQATVTGGIGNGTFVFSGPGVTGNVFDPATAGVGVHTVSMTYEENGPCILIDDFTIEVFAEPVADFSLSATEICTENLTVTFTGSAPAGTTYNWDFDGATVVSGTGAGPYELNWPAAGTYTISLDIETPGNCTSTAVPQDVMVSAPLAAPVITCGDSSLTTAAFNWATVPGALGYIIQIGGVTDTITETTYTATGLTPGESVSISVTPLGQDPCGDGPTVTATCAAAACPTITLNPSAPDTNFCLDGMTGAVVLSATSAGGDMTGSFTWSGAGVSQVGADYTFDPVAAGLGAHTLTVDYVETAGCGATATLVMNVYEVPTAAFNTSATTICEGETTAVSYAGTAGATATYAWDFDGAVVTPQGNEVYDLNWPVAGTYTVGLTVSENGCTSTASVEITVVAPLATPAPTCGVSGLTEVTFEWPAVAGATGYSVSINGQTPFTVNGTSHTETGLDESEVVTLTIIALGDAPCGDSEAATITCQSDPCPDISLLPAAAQTAFCTEAGDPPVLLELSINGGNGSGTVTWSGQGIVQNGDDYLFDASLLTPGTYVLTATYDESICSYSEEMVMQVNATPVAQFSSSTDALCSVSDITVSFNGTAGSGATYDWDFAGAIVTNNGGENYTLQWPNAGEYMVSLTVSQAGCSTSTSAMMSVSEPPVAGQQFQPREVCAGSGEIVELSSLLSGADTGGVWSPGIGAPAVVDAGSGQLNTFNLAPGTYEYLYTVAGGVCDDAVAGVMITIQPSPVANAGADQVLTCAMGMVSLNGSTSTGGSALTYAWTGPDGNPVPVDADNSMIDVSQPGLYTLTVTSDIGCTATDQVEVRAETEVPVPQVELNNISCFSSDDGTILVTGVDGGRPPYNYSLNGGAPGGTTFFTGLEQGEYSLRVSDANGCFSEIFLGVSQPDLLEVSVNLEDGTNDYDEGDLVTLSASISGGNVIDTIVWQPDSLNRVGEGTSNTITFVADQTRTISVTVTDENGCRATDLATILVRRDRPIYIPSGFSPNGDNVNDILFIGANNEQVVNIQRFLVFNRWGESVFENYDFRPNDPAQGWDGNHRGEPLNPAVFVYVAVVEFINGEVVTFKGDVTLIR